MAQDKTVNLYCQGCEDFRDVKLIPGTEKYEYIDDGDGQICWSAEYKCPRCKGTLYSEEYYDFNYEDIDYMEE